MKEVTYIGEEEYHGHDAANDDRKVDLLGGESTKVSDEKAAQLERDFPDWFLIDGNPCEGADQTAPPATDDDKDAAGELLEFGSDEYWANWDGESEVGVVAQIEAWGTGEGTEDSPWVSHPDADTIEQLLEHEEQHGNRPTVVDALDTTLTAAKATT